ncbi:MAG: type II secretion system protein [Thermoanaerobaculia bacterium]
MRRAGGFTFVEMVVVVAILAILASLVLPAGRFVLRRSKEAELRQHLRILRNAIDEYKRYSDAGLIQVEQGTDGYPAELELLVEGVEIVGLPDKKVRFLRRIPVDPMTGEAEWGLRSYQDEPDSDGWGGENVYDVYCLSEGTSLSGEPYSTW